MSSPINTATCVARQPQSVDLEIGPTSARGVAFPLSDFYGLALLYEAAATIVYRSPGQPWREIGEPSNAPIESAITFDEVTDFASIANPNPQKTALTKRFVNRVRYVATRNFAPKLWRRDRSGAFRDRRVPSSDRRAIAARKALDDTYHSIVDHRDDEARSRTLRCYVPEAGSLTYAELHGGHSEIET